MNKIIQFKKKIFTRDNIGYLMIFAAGCLWGTIGLFVNLLNSAGADTTLTAFMRMFMGCLILIPIMLHKGGVSLFKIDKKGLSQCFMLGILSQALFNYSYITSIRSVGIATAAILLYTAPVFVAIMSRMLFKESIGRIKILALIINIVGCFLMVTGGNLSNIKLSAAGIFFGVAAGFLYSLVTIIGKSTSGDIHPFTVVFYGFLFGGIAIGIFTSPWESIKTVSGLKFWIYSFGYGLIPTVGSYLLYLGGLRKQIEISKTPVIASVEIVVATLIGIIVFEEGLNFINMLGIIIIFSSIVIINMKTPYEGARHQ
ncbi:MAG TPA: EamA family transporter [Sedimentibacter sp.]|nr:EamA family transporter [Sedimentibacter sp.]